MKSMKVPSLHLETKLLVRAFEGRRKVLEQDSELVPDVARLQVLELAKALIEELGLLRDRVTAGALDK